MDPVTLRDPRSIEMANRLAYQSGKRWISYTNTKLGTIKKVEAFMLKNGKMRGGYQGCLSQSKWLGAREKYKWDEFIKHCPKLSQKVREVPNALLDVLGAGVPRQ